jgi:hypothetical protein
VFILNVVIGALFSTLTYVFILKLVNRQKPIPRAKAAIFWGRELLGRESRELRKATARNYPGRLWQIGGHVVKRYLRQGVESE